MNTPPPPQRQPLRSIDRLARRILFQRLAGMQHGALTIVDPLGIERFGQATDLQAVCRVHRPRCFRQALVGGSNALAESYVQGDWDCAELTDLFRIFVRNLAAADGLDRGMARLGAIAHRLAHAWNANHRAGSRRNIAAHYDLGNDFFALWLDDSLAYSCGLFRQFNDPLLAASIEKFDRVCRKLELSAGERVLEIGCGWGGFARHAAQHYGCQVTAATISRQQLVHTAEQVRLAGLEDRVQVIERDYRDLTGQYDKLVSIEMIEAVGHRYLDQFFGQCGRLLRSDGSLVLQGIVMPERRHAQYLQSVDFIQRYIFPGGCLPSVASLLEAAGRASDLRLVHLEDFAPHYAETLRRWRRRFSEVEPQVRALGYSTQFIRLWHYYLCYCEALFEERYVGLVQMVFDKPHCRRDPGRLSELAAAPTRQCERETAPVCAVAAGGNP